MRFIKKIFILFLASMLLVSPISVSASDNTAYFQSNELHTLIISDSFDTVTLDNENYIAADASCVDVYYNKISVDVKFTQSQKDVIKNVVVTQSRNNNEAILYIIFYFFNGTSSSVYYVKSDYVEAFNNLMSNVANYQIYDFPSYKETFDLTNAELRNSISKVPDVTLYNDYLMECDYYVITKADDTFTIIIGLIFTDNEGKFYFADCVESRLVEPQYFSVYSIDSLEVFTINEGDLLSRMSEVIEKSNSDYNISASAAAIVFLIIFCAICPLIIAIICFVFSFKARKSYKKILRTIALLCTVEIILFITALATALMNGI